MKAVCTYELSRSPPHDARRGEPTEELRRSPEASLGVEAERPLVISPRPLGRKSGGRGACDGACSSSAAVVSHAGSGDPARGLTRGSRRRFDGEELAGSWG